jgi:hypothetical protein
MTLVATVDCGRFRIAGLRNYRLLANRHFLTSITVSAVYTMVTIIVMVSVPILVIFRFIFGSMDTAIANAILL